MRDHTTEVSELTLHQLLRCRHVKRWHIVRVGRDQTVAEHSWAVTIIAHHLCDRLGLIFSPSEMGMLTTWALLHDSVETITGDIPTPTSEVIGGWLHSKEESLSVTRSTAKSWASTGCKGVPLEIVKAADTIEAITFLEDEAVGEHARRVLESLRGRLRSHTDAVSKKFKHLPWAKAIEQTLCDASTIIGPGHD